MAAAIQRGKKKGFRWSALVGAAVVGVVFAIAGAAFADDISNNLDATVDAVAEAMPLTVGGANGTTRLYVAPQNDDGKNGCNLTGSTTASISLASSNPSVATVSPSSITFTSCVDSTTGPIVTVTPVAQGTATISATLTSNTTAGTFNVAPVTFTVNVAPPPNTPPQVSVAGVTGGASYNKGSVPAATCEVTDAEDGNSSFAATLSAVTGPYASDGIGQQTASCSYTDGGGLTATASKTYAIVDPSAPGILSSVVGALGDDGWYVSNVSLSWTVSEPQSPNSLQKTGCVDQSITSDQAPTTYSCAAQSAGGSAGPVDVSIKRDATKPTIDGSASPAANGAAWNNSNVTVSFTCADNLSGIASCGPSETLSSEGAGQSSTGTAVDNAGNNDTATVSGINIDKTAPSVSLVGGPADGASYYFGSVPAAPTCNASDSLSLLDGACSISGYSAAVGSHTVTATAKDKAGNTASDSRGYTVLAWTLKGFHQPVDMGGVLNIVKSGSTVPLKFEIFVGTTELTDTANVKSLIQAKVNCDGALPTDEIETTATGGTSLRYDATAGQFVYNWQTPKTAGLCYRVTMTTQDDSSLVAYFRLK